MILRMTRSVPLPLIPAVLALEMYRQWVTFWFMPKTRCPVIEFKKAA